MAKKLNKKSANETKQKKGIGKEPNYKRMVIGCAFLVLIIILFYGIFYMSNKINFTSKNINANKTVVINTETTQSIKDIDKNEILDEETNDEFEYFKLSSKEIKKLPKFNDGNGKKVYLTFDDGPSANTNTIIKILNKYNAKATFFVLGGNLQYRINEITNMMVFGHTIGMHGISHDYYSIYSSIENFYQDLYKCFENLNTIFGISTKYYRFPGGSANTVSIGITPGIMSILTDQITKDGFVYYDWNVSTGDSALKVPDTFTIVERIINGINKQDIPVVLMHDTVRNKTSIEALEYILEEGTKKGYEFVAIDDLTPRVQFKVVN